MANASVDKLKEFGIRHGEKVVVGLTATLFVVFTALAVMKPTLDMKPEELSKAADGGQSNLQRKQDDKDVLAKLEQDGLKDPELPEGRRASVRQRPQARRLSVQARLGHPRTGRRADPRPA